jgi:hypothetical protein
MFEQHSEHASQAKKDQFNFAFFILTPAPLPFSLMNSTPAAFRTQAAWFERLPPPRLSHFAQI